jgi:hypothetical protein
MEVAVIEAAPTGSYWHWDPRLLDHGRTEVPRRDFEALFQAANAEYPPPHAPRAGQAQLMW